MFNQVWSPADDVDVDAFGWHPEPVYDQFAGGTLYVAHVCARAEETSVLAWWLRAEGQEPADLAGELAEPGRDSKHPRIEAPTRDGQG
ncbi:hypothetical protein [Streptomyces sp. NPDC001415]